jgi:hypothetical protein
MFSEGLKMQDTLMLDFIKAGRVTFDEWRAWAIDHGERHGDLSEFIGRYQRTLWSLKRRRL